MNTTLVAGNLLGITAEQWGTAKAATASMASEWTSAISSIAPRPHDENDFLVGVWVLIGTILSCLAIMMAVVIVAATSMP